MRPVSYLAALCALVLAVGPAHAQPVFDLDLQWYRFADPGGADPGDPTRSQPSRPGDGFEDNRGWLSGESAEFSSDGQLVVTASRGDGTFEGYPNFPSPGYPTPELTGGTAHLRLWTVDGELLWDRARSRGLDTNGDGRPDDQVADGADEIEIALFSAHPSNRDRYVLAGGEDDVIEVWEVLDAAGNVRAAPVLRRTLTMPAGREAAIDELQFSNNGELLLAGTEFNTGMEFFRVTGAPSTWAHVGSATHGGSGSQAVNAADFSSDDRFLVTAGSNEKGRLWELDVTRSGGAITNVAVIPRATMQSPDGPVRSAKVAEFEPGTDRHVILGSKDQRLFVYDTERLKVGDDTPVTVLSNSIYRGSRGVIGTEIEPGAYSTSGRFVVQGGGPRRFFPETSAGYESSFFRVYETAQLQSGAPEPDPVFVQRAFATEHFDFNEADTRLTTVHEDGTVRLWNVTAPGAVTVAAEAFNERTETHSRWTLSGPLSTAAGDNEWGVTTQPTQAEIDRPRPRVRAVGQEVTQDAEWAGHRGSRYLGADNLQGQLHALTLRDAWPTAGFSGLAVQFAAAALPGAFEGDDLLRLVADTDGDGAFETTVAEFTPDAQGDLAFGGRKATPIFEDHFVELGPLLPAGFDGPVRFRVEARTDGGGEELAFDGLRLIGTPTGASGTTRTYPGEDAALGGGSDVRTNHAGYRGSGYANFPKRNGTVAFDVDGGAGGPATLTFRYANGEAPRTVELRVNGVARQVSFPSTGSWSSWATREVTAELAPGAGNTVRVRSTGEDGPNLDELTVTAGAPLAGPAAQAEDAGEAEGLALALAAYPNPASSQATVAFTLPDAGDVRVEVYDALGRRVAVLAEGARASGRHEAVFDAGRLPAGLYVVRLAAGARSLTQALTLVR